MNFETYFNAYHESYTLWAAYEFGDPMEHYSNHDRRERQYLAFRDRILRAVAIYRNFAEANGYREDQAWFWTDEWQAAEKEVDRLIAKGEIHSFDSMAEFLEGLED